LGSQYNYSGKARRMFKNLSGSLGINKAIQREHYPIPTSDEIIPNFTGKKWFSVLNLKDGFWHMKLTDNSSDLCTF